MPLTFLRVYILFFTEGLTLLKSRFVTLGFIMKILMSIVNVMQYNAMQYNIQCNAMQCNGNLKLTEHGESSVKLKVKKLTHYNCFTWLPGAGIRYLNCTIEPTQLPLGKSSWAVSKEQLTNKQTIENILSGTFWLLIFLSYLTVVLRFNSYAFCISLYQLSYHAK